MSKEGAIDVANATLNPLKRIVGPHVFVDNE
jgi:hypothetical protein